MQINTSTEHVGDPAPYAIYALTDPRETDDIKRIRYVGKGPPLKRYREHVHAARRGIRRHCYNWFRNVLAAGLFPGQRILEWTTARDGSEREQAWICSLREQGADLTNLTDGGEGTPGLKRSREECARISAMNLGRTVSPEIRAKISAANMGKQNFLGHHHSEETRAKMSAARMGNKYALGNKNRLGQHPSEETKRKISNGLRGRVQSEETRRKRSLRLRGRVKSIETRGRLSVSLRGNRNALGCHRSDETKRRMSVARRAYWAVRRNGGIWPDKIQEQS